MADDAIAQSRAALEARLDELRPAVEEAARIEAALDALDGANRYPRPPVTALDMLKPAQPEAAPTPPSR